MSKPSMYSARSSGSVRSKPSKSVDGVIKTLSLPSLLENGKVESIAGNDGDEFPFGPLFVEVVLHGLSLVTLFVGGHVGRVLLQMRPRVDLVFPPLRPVISLSWWCTATADI